MARSTRAQPARRRWVASVVRDSHVHARRLAAPPRQVGVLDWLLARKVEPSIAAPCPAPWSGGGSGGALLLPVPPSQSASKHIGSPCKRAWCTGTPVFYAILVLAHLYFSRCASERERSERERCASSRVPFAISRFFASFCMFSRFFAIFVIFAIFSRFFARARASLALATLALARASRKIQVRRH